MNASNNSVPAPAVVGDKTVPESVHAKILELREIETRLGHLPTETFAVTDLHKRFTDPSQMSHVSFMEQRTETLFREIAGELHDCGWALPEIVQAINIIVCYAGGPKYCNEDEVAEVLGS
ncbi:MAG: hypothetical protein FJY29_03205 [Betaproteobacteria bacterium]|nr:hypothetical protein [Betaproteobacteria bacterium]